MTRSLSLDGINAVVFTGGKNKLNPLELPLEELQKVWNADLVLHILDSGITHVIKHPDKYYEQVAL